MIRNIFKKIALSFFSLLITVLFFSCTFMQETKTGKITFSTSSLLQNSSRAVLNISNGDFIEVNIWGDYTATKTVSIKDDSTIVFEEVPIDARIYAEVFIYRNSLFNKRTDIYSGKSEEIIIKEGENKLSVILKQLIKEDENAEYTVIHKFQNIDDDNYTVEAETLKGKVSDYTEAKTIARTGFTAKTFDQKEIQVDNSTTIEIYYERNLHKVSYLGDFDEGTDIPETKQYRYGATIKLEVEPKRTGYIFGGWKTSDKDGNEIIYKPEEQITIDDYDITLTAYWNNSNETQYQVIHYLQNIDDDEYIKKETEVLYGETLGQTKATAKSYDGFIAQTINQQEIKADGSTIIEIRYNRKTFTISYADGVENEEIKVPSDTKQYRYGASAAINYTDIETRTGYTFQGWKDTANDILYESDKAKEITIGEANITLYAQWRANKYSITYNLNGGKWADGYTAPDSYTYGEQQNLPDADKVIRTGYGLTGWYTETGTPLTEIKATMTGNISLLAQWEAGLTNYTVRHWQQNTADDKYTEMTKDAQVLTGSSESETSAKAKSYTGFTAKSFDQQKIASDGSTIIDIYYDRNVHSISYAAGADDDTITLPAKQEFRYGAKVNIDFAKIARRGFDFTGWMDAEGNLYEQDGETSFVMKDNDVTLTAQWTAASHTLYTVIHLQQNIDDDYYTEVKSDKEEKYGTSLEQTKAEAKSYTGFTAQTITQKTIDADGSTVIEIKYNRNTYTVSYEGGADSVTDIPTDKETYRYGATITVANTEPARTGYVFDGWQDSEGNVYTAGTSFEIGTTDITLTAQWKASSDTKYTVQHLLQNIYDDDYTTEETEVLHGDTLAQTNAKAKAYEGFNTPTVTQQEIKADGSTVIKIKYNRKTATITYEDGIEGENISVPLDSTQYRYGASVEINYTDIKTRNGYTFAGWKDTANDTIYKSDEVKEITIGEANVTLYAQWTANKYTITYDLNSGEWAEGYTAPDSYTYGEQKNLPDADKVLRTGYGLKGWYTANGTQLTEIAAGTTGNIVLTAQWEAGLTKYTVHHMLQNVTDDSYEENKDDVQVLTGQSESETSAKAKSYTGFTAKTINQQTITSDGKTEVSIYYDRDVHSIIYAAGADDETIALPASQDFRYGADVSIDFSKAAREGFDFAGWKDAGGNLYKADGVKVLTMGDSDVTLTAQWTAVAYNITYYSDGKDITDTDGCEIFPKTYTIEDSAIDLSAYTLKKTGATFVGWYEKADFSGTALTSIKTNLLKDIVLYAKWTYQQTISVTIESGDWSSESTSSTFALTYNSKELSDGQTITGDSGEITLTATELSGYTYTWKVNGKTTDSSGTTYGSANTLTLKTTSWKKGVYDISVKATDGKNYQSCNAQIKVGY